MVNHPYAAATPVSETSSPQLPSPSQWSQNSSLNGPGANGYGTLARSDSLRPRGALAPAVPGQQNGYTSPTTSHPSADLYTSSPQADVSITLVRPPDPPPHLYNRVDPVLRPYSPSHAQASYPSSIPRVPSRNTMDAYGRSSTEDGRLLSPTSSLVATGSTYNSMLDANQTPTCELT